MERLSTSGLLVTARPQAEDPSASPVEGITCDSREVRPGWVFVAIRGHATDGHAFIPDALERGAVAVVVEEPVAAEVPVFEVESSRSGLARLAAAFYGDPSLDLTTCGVTGTNGKTTTAWLLSQALTAAGHRCGYMGTIGYGLPGKLEETAHTTPDAVRVQRALGHMRQADCDGVAMEVSSHALDQRRAEAVDFDAAVFTNLTRDHLNYHGSFEAYFDAKALLFEGLRPEALAVINMDDPAGTAMADRATGRTLSYGTTGTEDVSFTVRSDLGHGIRMRLDGHDATFRLSGSFNAYNLAAAYAAMEAYGVAARERLDALAEARPAPGRFEIIDIGRERSVVIDFAHTPDALRNVLSAARGIVPAGANLWCVFGCGGDRDTGKRPLMGGIAEELADRVIVTSDNPRTEDPEAIQADIRSGVSHPERMHWIVDRRQAVHRAVETAGLGDVIVLAGKGPEPYQIIGTEKRPYLDEAVVREAAGV
ncbi:MAG: UDP-N-acetylmuramoyl-L-alanyl-D-glutamate--2,6-diaminopimelate ligase [Rhodothermales bacterium]|nr:UDP-N-acetylmuramoyl-L-alanyl-D-glutamate--2,6-diaminopimelate ligase [Rhodothermales bacterium]